LGPMADLSAARGWLDAEHANLVAVIGFAADNEWHIHTWQLAHLLQYYFNISARPGDWLSTLGLALASTRALRDRHAEAEILRRLGLAYLAQGRYHQALAQFSQALSRYRELGDRVGEGVALNNLGMPYERLDRYDDAVRCYQQALAIRQAIGHHR